MNRIAVCSVIHDTNGNVRINASGEGSNVIVNGVINNEVKRLNEERKRDKGHINKLTKERNEVNSKKLDALYKRIFDKSTATKIANAVIFVIACAMVYATIIIKGD